ncbi:MAG: 50S ribosomal protein L13 [Vampirovibrionales bacterium]
MKTYSAKETDVQKQWFVVDAEGKTLGRLATEIAILLRGKHKPLYTPHIDCGDNVIIINSEKVVVTGKKQTQKLYRHHTGYLGHLKTFTYTEMMAKDPTKVVELAVWGMIPHNRLGRRQIKKLHVYAGNQHPHQAQQPKEYVVAGK